MTPNRCGESQHVKCCIQNNKLTNSTPEDIKIGKLHVHNEGALIIAHKWMNLSTVGHIIGGAALLHRVCFIAGKLPRKRLGQRKGECSPYGVGRVNNHSSLHRDRRCFSLFRRRFRSQLESCRLNKRKMRKWRLLMKKSKNTKAPFFSNCPIRFTSFIKD